MENQNNDSSDGNFTIFSPVSGLTAAFCSQSLDTPRRRLSLDTDASSGTPIDTPSRLALILENVTPDSSSITDSPVADHSPGTTGTDVAGVEQDDNSVRSNKPMTKPPVVDQTMLNSCINEKRDGRVPSLVFSSFHSSRSTSSSGSEDLRTPGVLISPAPSPVFAVDDDSRDSGYGGDGAAAAVATGSRSMSDDGSFLHPLPRTAKAFILANLKVCDDGFDGDDGIFDAVLEMDEEMDTLPSGCAEPIASLLRGEILYDSNKGSHTVSEPQASINETPLKRKSSCRSLRSMADRRDVAPKRPVYSNQENDEENGDRIDSNGPPLFKRRKSYAADTFTSLRAPLKLLNRSHSETEAQFALHREDTCHLIGDQSTHHALPLLDFPHVNDLKCINGETLRRLLNGEFDDTIHRYSLIDCRYPYEYEGGHIKGAVNVYTQEELALRMLNESIMEASVGSLGVTKREIFIFYCEFSRERGPKMTRFLRKRDRQINEHQYPKLFYPEIYLLDGGYKNFYASCSDLCEPRSYRSMLDEDHVNDLRKFRSKSKSWCSGGGDASEISQTRRPGLNRGLFSSKGY